MMLYISGLLCTPPVLRFFIYLLGDSVNVEDKEGIMLVMNVVYTFIFSVMFLLIRWIEITPFKKKKKQPIRVERKIPNEDLFKENQMVYAISKGILVGATTKSIELISNSKNEKKQAMWMAEELWGNSSIKPYIKRVDYGE